MQAGSIFPPKSELTNNNRTITRKYITSAKTFI